MGPRSRPRPGLTTLRAVTKPLLKTDEWTDRLVSRPLAALIVKAVAPTPITPNWLTVVAASCGVALGVALWMGNGLLAAFLTLAYLVFDCTDGQLARLRGGGGVLGRIADGCGDYLAAIALHLGLVAWLVQLHGWIAGLLWGVGAGISMAWTSGMLDRYKRRYLAEIDDIDEVRRLHAASTGRERLLYSIFLLYAPQVKADVTPKDLPAYQQRARGPLQLWLIAGPSGHLTALAICCALDRPLLYAWIAVLPFNLIGAIAWLWQHRVNQQTELVDPNLA